MSHADMHFECAAFLILLGHSVDFTFMSVYFHVV